MGQLFNLNDDNYFHLYSHSHKLLHKYVHTGIQDYVHIVTSIHKMKI